MSNGSLHTDKKNNFASHLGFILAASGSAVGLGNLWGFPYKTGANGGAAFVFVYILMVLLLGIVAMSAEIVLGRRAQANPITAFKKVNPNLGFIGLLAIIIPFIITCYYSVLGGYTIFSAANSFVNIGKAFSEVNAGMDNFMSGGWLPVICTFIFLALAILVIFGGVQKGIEKSSKVLMPALFIILVAVMIYSLCLGDGVTDGLKFYILQLDFKALGWQGVIKAMGQAFYSLSLGMGIMISYGSYTGEEVNVGKSACQICIIDTVIALFAGFAIFPAAYHFAATEGVDLATLGMGGFKLMYYTLPQVFASMGVIGGIVGFFFFLMVIIAALTSIVSLLEVVTQFTIQKGRISRKKAAVIPFILVILFSIPVSMSLGGSFTVFGFDLLTFLDEISNTVLMPIAALGSCLVVGWGIPKKDFVAGMNCKSSFPSLIYFMIKFITPILILVVEVFGIVTGVANTSYWYVVSISYALIIVIAAIYFIFFKKSNSGCNADEIELAKK